LNSTPDQVFLEKISTITAFAVERYLELNNWHKRERFKNPNLMVFNHCKFDKEIALPCSEKFDDFYRCLLHILPYIALWERKDITEIINEMNAL